MKNIILNGQTYSGISEVSLPISGGTALFKDKDEIIEPSGSLSITANGTYDVADKASANVNVPAPEINLQNKTATANGEVTADEGYDGLGVVTVAVSGDVPTLITKSITANGTYNASADSADGYSSVTVNVPAPELPTLTNPASAAEILSGKEALDGDGAKLTGACTFDADTSDADATAADIAKDKTAYVNGQKVVGTHEEAAGGLVPFDTYTFTLDQTYTSETLSTITTLATLNYNQAMFENVPSGSGYQGSPRKLSERTLLLAVLSGGNTTADGFNRSEQIIDVYQTTNSEIVSTAPASSNNTNAFRGQVIFNSAQATFVSEDSTSSAKCGLWLKYLNGTSFEVRGKCQSSAVTEIPAGTYTINFYKLGI